jgi:hypothetical protein
MQADFDPSQLGKVNQIINKLSPLRILNRLLAMLRLIVLMIIQIEPMVTQGICSSPHACPRNRISAIVGFVGQAIVTSRGARPAAKVGTPRLGEFPPV